jgi:hypothetical protein
VRNIAQSKPTEFPSCALAAAPAQVDRLDQARSVKSALLRARPETLTNRIIGTARHLLEE